MYLILFLRKEKKDMIRQPKVVKRTLGNTKKSKQVGRNHSHPTLHPKHTIVMPPKTSKHTLLSIVYIIYAS